MGLRFAVDLLTLRIHLTFGGSALFSRSVVTIVNRLTLEADKALF
jgi:hypothetical protein